ncbi:hypothetical protein N9059_00185 [bacterium]|nr:hypothetical protein [bacterium]
MKTTFDIADNILERSRRLSKEQSVTLRSLVEEGLELVLERRSVSKSIDIQPVTFGGEGLSPEYRSAPWSAIRNAIYPNS